MRRSRFGLLLVLLACPLWGMAQPPKADAKPTSDKVPPPRDSASKKPEAPEFDVTFIDAGNVKVTVLNPKLEVSTKYGKLSIPMSELKRVELGFRYPEGIEAKLTAAIEKLGAPEFQDREDAEVELMKLKDYALPLLRVAAKRETPELSQRAQSLIKLISIKTSPDRLHVKDYDVVETVDLLIRGRVELSSLKVKSKQFGETTLQLAEVKHFRGLGVNASLGELELDATKYCKLNWSGWLDTGFDVSAELPLEITSSGQIDIWPQEPGRYMASPQGTGAPAPNPPQMLLQPQQPLQANGGINPAIRGFVPTGSVIARIGENGTPFIIGANFKRPNMATNGRLYLQIAPSNWNNDDCTGSYRVKIKVGE
jgi:hypothetical protein